MSKIKLMIVDVDPIHTLNVCRSFSEYNNIDIISTETNGIQAMNNIEKLAPDVVLTDVQLPGMDGIMLLKETRHMKRPPLFIFSTHFYSDYIMEKAQRNGAAYFLYKPLEYHSLPMIVCDCYEAAQTPLRKNYHHLKDEKQMSSDRIRNIHLLLVDMGMSPKLIGSMYLIESVIMAQNNSLLLSNLSKGLYAEISSKMNSTPACIERSLRNAISVGYERGGLAKYFSHRPTNKEFIRYLLKHSDETYSNSKAEAQ